MAATSSPKQEIYTYEAPWSAYALAWSNRGDKPFRVAVGSIVEEYANKVALIELDEEANVVVEKATFSHPYPVTKALFSPDDTAERDLLATTGDYLRLWNVTDGAGGETKVKMAKMFNNNKNTEFCAPLTSFDWNSIDHNVLATSSIDTTITVWDIEKEKAITQIIAHDKEVYDVAFGRGALGPHVFASVGGDGSIRMFDRRHLKHSTIIYETKDSAPLLRLSWNIQDPNYIACIKMDSSEIFIVDIRVPAITATRLLSHTASTNAIAWAPHSSCHICSAADDRQAYIWDVSSMSSTNLDPILCYTADDAINNLQWSSVRTDWVAIAYDDHVQMLHV